MSRRESEIQRKILKWLKQQGIYAVKSVIVNHNGVPDIICCVDGRFVAIEVKSENGQLTELQKLNLQSIEESGGIVFVGKSKKDVELFIHKLKGDVK